MRAILVLVCAVFAVGCADKVLEPTGVQAQAQARPTVTAECKPFDLTWEIHRDMSGPIVTLTGNRANAVEVLEAGEPYMRGSNAALFDVSAWTFNAHFNQAYSVRGRVGACWSSWHEFRVGPANPDASDTGAPDKPVRVEWTQCTDVVFTAGRGDVTFSPPVTGAYELTVTAKDGNHRPGYQVGQAESVKVQTDGWLGFTSDIPDELKEVSQTWEGLRGPIRITGSQGSVHGVCVTVRQ